MPAQLQYGVGKFSAVLFVLPVRVEEKPQNAFVQPTEYCVAAAGDKAGIVSLPTNMADKGPKPIISLSLFL